MRALAVVVALAVTLTVTPAFAYSPERRFVRRINAERVEQGLPVLHPGARLSDYAERHARAMARAGDIFHSDLSFPKPTGWRLGGENVGAGGTVAALHRAFMESPHHRANVLEPIYRRVGLGVVRRDGRLWVVEVFVG